MPGFVSTPSQPYSGQEKGSSGSSHDGAGQRWAPKAYYANSTFESYDPYVSSTTNAKDGVLPSQMHFHDALFFDATETVEGALASSDVPFVEITQRIRFVAVVVRVALLCTMVRFLSRLLFKLRCFKVTCSLTSHITVVSYCSQHSASRLVPVAAFVLHCVAPGLAPRPRAAADCACTRSRRRWPRRPRMHRRARNAASHCARHA